MSTEVPSWLADFPVQNPPEGVTRTLQPEKAVSRWIHSVIAVSCILTTIAAAIRLFTKTRVVKRIDWHDWAFLATYGLYAGFAGVTAKAISRGAYHQWNLVVKDAHFFLYWYATTATIYEFLIAAIKVIIVLELIRIFVPRRKGPLFWCYVALIVVSCISGALCGLLEIFHCLPLKKAYYPLLLISPTYGHCIDIDTARIYFSAGLVLQDLALLLLPQYSIWRLRMSRKKRIGVSVLFGLGIAGCVASSIRLFYTVKAKKEPDALWNLTFLGVCLGLEATCGMIVAASPVFPRFLKWVRDDVKLESSIKQFIHKYSHRGDRSSHWRYTGSTRHSAYVSPLDRQRHQQKDQKQRHQNWWSQLGTTYEMLDNTQISADSADTAVSASEQAKHSHMVPKKAMTATQWSFDEIHDSIGNTNARNQDGNVSHDNYVVGHHDGDSDDGLRNSIRSDSSSEIQEIRNNSIQSQSIPMITIPRKPVGSPPSRQYPP